MIERIAAALRSLVTRGQVQSSAVATRTMLQISGMAGETAASVELLLPPGYSANLVSGVDVAVLQVGGMRDHLVALGGDAAGSDQISGLAAGEVGMRNPRGPVQFVLRNTGTIEISGAVRVEGDLHVTGDILDHCDTQPATLATFRQDYDQHTHNNVTNGTSTSGLPSPQV